MPKTKKDIILPIWSVFIMDKTVRKACILIIFCLFSAGVLCQEETRTSSIPGALLRPQRGEAPRYPRDLVIGELGQGEAPDEAYRLARDILSALTTEAENAPALAGTASLITGDLIETIRSIEPRAYRLGGGRNEADGSVSFLMRFFGPEESITGELFMRLEKRKEEKKEESEDAEIDEPGEINGTAAANTVVAANGIAAEKWVLDDFILEEKRALSDIRDSYRYDFSPYERFF